MALLDQFGHPLPPVSTSRMTARASRDAGAYRGSISGWRGPQVHSPEGESRERDVMQRRAADLAANDWAAHSAVEAISGNAIGTGLVPKASIPADMLGISSESARELGKRMEWAFALWTSEADVRGQCHFVDLQNLGLRTMLSLGEMLHLAVMLNEKERERQNRTFSLALQTLSPARLMTPSDQQSDPLIRDGVRLSEYGRPEGYWLATPKASPQSSFLSVERRALLSEDFTYVPARVGHRPGVFHLFRHETDEQVRGVSAFSKGIELFRNLSDAISYELFAQVIAASFPVFVALENGGVQLPDYVTEGREGDGERRERQLVQDLSPGQFLYGNENEKPYVLESKRPSANFSAFVEIVLRATAASVGIPYESLTKDFSKTNYSSARAALNEAWKLYSFYRNWFGRLYCQPVYEMVIEEAFLRGMFELPKGAPGFYEARKFWCNVDWIGPSRGFVDPVKEITATILALQNRLMTYGEAWAETGRDFDEGYARMLEESPLLALLFDMAEQVLAELALAKAKPQALVEGFPERKARGYELVGGVAVIPVSGAIVREQGWYGTGQDAVSSALKAALADPSARAILLDINSPGGVVSGTKELSDAIAEARTKKRCAAYANGLCASAAYWLASATGTVYAPLTATVGSIGVIMTITNYAKLEEKWGISTVTITGGKWKAAGQGGELTEEERQYFQERINTLHQIFKADVGRHMGLTADPQLWGEAQLLLAQPARELGLVTDIVRDRDAAIRKLAVEAQMTREELAAQSPELVDALLAEGRLKAEAENKANMDKAAADAVAGALAVVKAVAGDETASRVETTLNTFRATEMSAEQIATVAPLLAKAEAPVHENAEAKSRAGILTGLQNGHQNPVAASPGTVPTATTKSPLLADAERRAEVAK